MTEPEAVVETPEPDPVRDYSKVSLETWIRLATYFIDDLGLHGEEVEAILIEAGDVEEAEKAKAWREKYAVYDDSSE